MKMRPVDALGDVLPVLSGSDMVMDAEAVALLVHDRLVLLVGEWWENESWGNRVLQMLQEQRLTEANADALSVYLSDYVRETREVQELMDIRYEIVEKVFHWQCTVLTSYGSAAVLYEI